MSLCHFIKNMALNKAQHSDSKGDILTTLTLQHNIKTLCTYRQSVFILPNTN